MLPNVEHHITNVIDDGKYIDLLGLGGYTFPGYLVHPEFPLIPLNIDTVNCTEGTRHPDGQAMEILWCMGDSKEQFITNSKKLGSEWHYYDKTVTYKLNRNGYRSTEWSNIDWKNSIVILGCSMIFGVGVAEDETINYYLQEMIGRPVVNIGYPAGSNEIIFNNSVAIFENFGIPASVITAWSTTDRFKYYTPSHSHDVGLWTTKSTMGDVVDLYELYTSLNANQTNQHIKSYYLEKANRAIWKDRSEYYTFSFFESTAHYMRLDTHFKIVPDARDLIHPGRNKNLEIAKHLYKTLRERGL
jgi:hypothetical protein